MAECGCSASQPIAMPNFLGPRVNVTTEAAQLRHIGAGILTIRVLVVYFHNLFIYHVASTL